MPRGREESEPSHSKTFASCSMPQRADKGPQALGSRGGLSEGPLLFPLNVAFCVPSEESLVGFFLFACFLLKTALVTTQKTIPNRPVLLGNKRNSGGNGESKEIHRAGNGPQVAVKTRVFSAGMRSLMSPHGPSSTPRPTSAPRLGRVGGKVWGSEVLRGLRLGTCGLESPSAFTGLSARFPKSSD